MAPRVTAVASRQSRSVDQYRPTRELAGMPIDRSTPALSSLFQELILEHYRRPRNKGELDAPDAQVHMNNPTCGDEVLLQLRLKDGVIEDARFMGEGCSISQASISMMTQLVKGRTAADALALATRFTAMMHGDAEAARDRQLGDLRSLAGVAKYPVRVKCALLGWNALEEALPPD
jgi:nitrogen fixation protein NifU and related proteins